MVEGLMLWDAGQMLLRPILEDLAKEVATDAAKSYVGRCFKSVFSVIHRDALTKAIGRALKELLEHIEDELLDADLGEEAIKKLIPAIQAFLDHDAVRGSIHSLFLQPGYKALPQEFANAWSKSNPNTSLPDEFSWQKIAKRFTRKVEDIRNGDVELKATFDSLANAQNADNLKELSGLPPEFDLDAYREALVDHYGNLRFDSLDTSGAYYQGIKLWSVFTPQSVRESHEYAPQLAEVPKEHQKRLIEADEIDPAQVEDSEKRRQAYFEQAPRPVLGLCEDDSLRQLVILGDPGSGKSTLLRYLALDWARIENTQERYTRPLPLLIELRQYNDWQCDSGKDFVRYLHGASNWHRLNQHTLDYLLKQPGRVILMLDGLDEVILPRQRESVLNDIKRFSNQYKTTRVILTSRVVGYKPAPLRDAKFRHFMLQDLNHGQIDEFLDHWHKVTFDDATDAKQKQERLSKAIKNSKAIAMLAGNPLLLTMMAILNRNQELPRDRAELYEQASRVLLQQWDTERALQRDEALSGEIDLRAKRAILRKLAHHMQTSEKGLAGNIIDGESLSRLIEDYLRKELGFQKARAAANALVAELRERNFILCHLGADNYGFVHRTFLEYFCAADIVHRFQVEQQLSEAALQELFIENSGDESWSEVLRLICGQIDEKFVERIVERLADTPDLDSWDGESPLPELPLAAFCLSESRNTSRLRVAGAKLLEKFLVLAQRIGVFEKAGEFFLEQISPAIRELGEQWPGRSEIDIVGRAVSLLRNNRRPTFGEDILVELVVLVVADHEAAIALLKFEEGCEDGVWIRHAALQSIASKWPDDATRTLLNERAVHGEDVGTRRTALDLLAKHWPDETTRTLLCERAVQDKDERPRRLALELLAEHWPDENTRSLLSERAVQDKDEGPRLVALALLAEHWPDETTRKLISELAPANGPAASLLGKEHSEFGRILYTRDLDGDYPLLDPRKPVSRKHIEEAARMLSIDPEHIDETVRSLSEHLGWDITKGSAAD